MKGVTPVIAVILLLLITVSMVGFAFVWFTQITKSVTNSTQGEIDSTIKKQGQKISIDNVNNVTRTMTIRNIGSQTINLGNPVAANSEVAIFISVNSTSGLSLVLATACPWAPTAVGPGQYATCTWSGTDCWGGVGRVKVTAPGNFDERNC